MLEQGALRNLLVSASFTHSTWKSNGCLLWIIMVSEISTGQLFLCSSSSRYNNFGLSALKAPCFWYFIFENFKRSQTPLFFGTITLVRLRCWLQEICWWQLHRTSWKRKMFIRYTGRLVAYWHLETLRFEIRFIW